MRGPGGLAGEGTFEQEGNLLIGNAAWSPRPQLIVQTGHTLLEKTLAPLAHRDLGPAQTLRDHGIALALGRPQHDFGAADEGMRQATRSRETLQLGAFVHRQFEGGFGASGEHNAAYRCLCNIASYLWDITLGREKNTDRKRAGGCTQRGRGTCGWQPRRRPGLRGASV